MACMIIFFLVGAKKQMFCLEQCKHVLNILGFQTFNKERSLGLFCDQ